MKKLLLLAAGALLSVSSASAARWFISGAFQNWQHAQAAYELKEGVSGVFSIDVTNLSGEFLIVQGTPGNADWNNKVGGATITETGKAYNYVDGGGNFNITVTVPQGTVVLDTNNKTITVNGASEANDYDVVYLVGDFGSGWSETDTSYPLTLKDGTDNVWTGEYVLTGATSYFKMRAGNYIYGTGGGDQAVALGTEYTASQSGNAYSLPAGAYNFEFVLDKNADSGVLKVTDADIAVDYTQYYVNVLGTFNNWEDNGVACDSEGMATLNDLEIGTGEFKIKVWTGSQEVWYSNGEANAIDTLIKINGNSDDNMTVAGATEGDKYNVTFDAKTGEMVIVKVESETPDPNWPDLYVLGDFNGFTASNAYKMTRTNNVYTYDFKDGINPDDPNGSFIIWSEDAEWAFGAKESGQEVKLGETVDAWFNGDYWFNVFVISTNEPTKVTLNVVEGSTVEDAVIPAKLSFQSTTGVAELDADNTEAVYFNLQGVRVANPENGLFIKVQGNKTSKVAL